MKIDFEKAACILSALGFIASLIAVIVIWNRTGTPIADAPFFFQPLTILVFTGIMAMTAVLTWDRNRRANKK